MSAAARTGSGCAVEALDVVDGIVANGEDGRAVALGELLANDVPEVEETFHNHKHTYAYGSVAAHVTVDPETGAGGADRSVDG